MDSDVTQSLTYYKALAWLDVHKKQVILGTIVAIVLGIVVWFMVYQHQQKQIRADEALSEVFVPLVTGARGKTEAVSGYLAVHNKFSGTPAAPRALLLAATALFTQGDYAEAQKRFESFAREHRDSPFLAEAQLGIAASLDAQGKTNEAITAYQTIVDRRAADNVIKPAKFALARLQAAAGNHQKAYDIYEDIARSDAYSSFGSEAGMRAEELKLKYPELAKAMVIPTNTAPVITITTNAPPAAPEASNAAPAPISEILSTNQ